MNPITKRTLHISLSLMIGLEMVVQTTSFLIRIRLVLPFWRQASKRLVIWHTTVKVQRLLSTGLLTSFRPYQSHGLWTMIPLVIDVT